MGAAVARRNVARKVSARKKRQPETAVVVAKDERLALVEDVAFFRASRFREVDPGNCREEDRCAAEADIKAVLKKIRKRSP